MSESARRDRLFVGIQKLLPTRALSLLMYRLTRIRWRPFKNLHIQLFMKGFTISLDDAVQTDPSAYATFNDFFTRALKPGAREITADPLDLISPVDGTVSQIGQIQQGRIIQAKGHDYSLTELLGGDAERASAYEGGSFCTIYLAPYNYHRIHMPVDGSLCDWTHVPGRLFSVNAATVRQSPGVFVRNERVVCNFKRSADPWALVMVGALFVGSIETVWAGQITPPYPRAGSVKSHPAQRAVALKRGEEMGRFNMGSTVILLFPPNFVAWEAAIGPLSTVRLGQRLGRISRCA